MRIVSEERFDLRVKPGGKAGGVVHVDAGPDRKIRGEFFSDASRIMTETDRFSGSKLKLRFRVDAGGLSEGDIVSGNLLLATDLGEFRIPVHMLISLAEPESDGISVRDLNDFCLLANEDPDRALKLFKSQSFIKLIPKDHFHCGTLYRGLAASPVTAQSVEEFLVGNNLKEPVEIRMEDCSAEWFSLDESIRESILLRRNTWGTFAMKAETDTDFIEFPTSLITDQDFVGSACCFYYVIRREKLGRGIRRGTIRLKYGATQLVYEVTASAGARTELNPKAELDALTVRLTELLEARRLGRLSGTEAADQAITLLDEMKSSGASEKIDRELLRAELLTDCRRIPEAAEKLTELKARVFASGSEVDRSRWLFLAGLSGMISVDAEETAEKMRTLFMRNRGDLIALDLMFRTNKDLAMSPGRRLRYEEKVYEEGVRSPLLYAAVLLELRENAGLLAALTPMMIQVLNYAVRKQLLTEELALRAAFLSENLKNGSALLLRTLKAAYKRWPIDGILEAVVRLMLRGRAQAPGCFEWYEKAVEKGLRIIRLHEYYIETMPEMRRGILPLPVRKYFLYNNTLSDAARARLYANIVRNRRTDQSTYAAYREKAEAFAKKSLESGKINPDYAVLYQRFIDRVTDCSAAEQLLDIVFTRKIYADDAFLRRVVVIHRGLLAEEVVPLVHSTAYVHIFTEDAAVLFEDAEGRRFASVPYSAEPLVEREAFLMMCREKGASHEGLLLMNCERYALLDNVSDEALRGGRDAAENPLFTDEFRTEIRRKILRSALLKEDRCRIDAATPDTVLANYVRADRVSLVRLLLKKGMYRKAYELILRYGAEDIEAQLLVRLAGKLIEEAGDQYDEELGLFAAHVFRTGVFDERILAYLTAYFRGSIWEMLKIRREAAGFYIETHPIDERILERAVFTGQEIEEGPEVLSSYAAAGGNSQLIRQYLEFRADKLLGGGETMSRFEAAAAEGLLDAGETVDFAVKIELLKYFSAQSKLTVHEEVLTDQLLEECMRRNIRLAFFSDFKPSFVRQYRLDDRVLIEQKAETDDTVILEYVLEDKIGGHAEQARREPMSRLFRGIFSKEFTLFYGEKLTCTVTVVHDGEEYTGSKREVAAPKPDISGKSAYQRINRMLFLLNENSTAETRELLGEYLLDRSAAARLFQLEE